jgi:hypothetical protein
MFSPSKSYKKKMRQRLIYWGSLSDNCSKRRFGKMRIIIGAIVLGLGIYAALDPFHHSPIADFPDFKAHTIECPPWAEFSIFPTDSNNRLQKADLKSLNGVSGPESLAFDPENKGPYTGTADGRILRWDGPNLGWSQFAYTSPNRHVIPLIMYLSLNFSWQFFPLICRSILCRYEICDKAQKCPLASPNLQVYIYVGLRYVTRHISLH